MRIRWRGLELPSRVVRDEAVSTDSYGRFIIEPFEQGYGTTVGNSLRRVLLSSLEGSAVTTVKIAGVTHEFATMEGVLEDVADILLNIKGIVLRMDGDEPKTIRVTRDSPGEVKAGDISSDSSVNMLNPDHLLCTLTAKVKFDAEMTVAKGRGYATGSENRGPEQELGVIPIDSIFSPVLRVRYHTEDMRVGQKTNYDRLIMEIWTNGTILPDDALVEAGLILRKHLSPIVMFHQMGNDVVTPAARPSAMVNPLCNSATETILQRPVSSLNLSVRASNCLEAGKIATLGQLVERTEADLLRFRSFGKTSLHEVQRKLEELGLRLGMKQGEAAPGASPITKGDIGPDGGYGDSTVGADRMEAFTMGD